MVRHKTRHFLLRLDFEQDLRTTTGRTAPERSTDALTKKDIFKRIRDTLLSSFGVAASGVAHEIQVRFYDDEFQLVMMRVPRDGAALVRSALSLITSLNGRRVVMSTISVNGSTRTAKMATILEYKRRLREGGGDNRSSQRVRELEERISLVRGLD